MAWRSGGPRIAGRRTAAALGAVVLCAPGLVRAGVERLDSLSSSPVTTIGGAELGRSGGASVEDVLSKLPQCPSPGGTAAGGVALRGLGATRPLVLLDGRRVGGSSAAGVDLDAIPSSAIDRVEVLKDGASSIYGGDACSGVVNVILRKDAPGALGEGALVSGLPGGAGNVRVGYDADTVCDFGAGAPMPILFTLPRSTWTSAGSAPAGGPGQGPGETAPGAKPAADAGSAAPAAGGAQVDTLRVSMPGAAKARFDVYPLDFGARWPLPGAGARPDASLGASEGASRALLGGGRSATFRFSEIGLDPVPVPSGVTGGEWSIAPGLTYDWSAKHLDLALDYAPREQRVIELRGKAGAEPIRGLDAFPRDVLAGIPSEVGPYLQQGYRVGSDLYLTFGWPGDAKVDLGAFRQIPGYTADENDACAEEAQPAASAAASGDGGWALERVGLGGAGPAAGGAPVVVGVVDTGLDWFHAGLDESRLWRNPGEVPGNGVDDDRNGYVDDVLGWDFVGGSNKPWDYDGHGTFVAGIVAGTSPVARIMVLKAVNGFGHTRASLVAQAVVYGADNGAKILNVSIAGAGLPRALQSAIRYAESKGVLVVVAAGNDGREIADVAPAGLAGVLAVAATDESDARAPFSNHGDGVALAAPGTNLVSLRARRTDFQLGRVDGYAAGGAFVGGDRLRYRASGTSFAAPIVAGVASLVWSKTPGLSSAEVRQRLEQTARDVEVPGRDRYTGFGVVDARAALADAAAASIVAEIAQANPVKDGDAVLVEVVGTAKADRFRRAWLELGEGESPASWRKVGEEIGTSVEAGALGRIPASAFAGAKVWTLRLVVEHEDGRTREVRYVLKLG